MLGAFLRGVHAAQSAALAVTTAWWRPAAEWSVAGSIFVSGIYLPIKNHTAPDLGTLAALVGAATGFVAARSFEAIRGGGNDA
jgi:hypothetical protein